MLGSTSVLEKHVHFGQGTLCLTYDVVAGVHVDLAREVDLSSDDHGGGVGGVGDGTVGVDGFFLHAGGWGVRSKNFSHVLSR